MQLKKLAVISTLLALVGMTFVPTAFADPINANLSWAPNPTTQGSTTTGTFGVNDVLPGTSTSDQDCPSGDTYTGTLTVVEPDLTSTSTVGPITQNCGDTSNTATYPTAFTGTASTEECGTYAATWAGTTSALVGGVHPTFSVTDNFVVTCKVTGAPQFTSPLMLVAALGLVLVAAAKKGRLLKL